jgi:hypothetical protein
MKTFVSGIPSVKGTTGQAVSDIPAGTTSTARMPQRHESTTSTQPDAM